MKSNDNSFLCPTNVKQSKFIIHYVSCQAVRHTASLNFCSGRMLKDLGLCLKGLGLSLEGLGLKILALTTHHCIVQHLQPSSSVHKVTLLLQYGLKHNYRQPLPVNCISSVVQNYFCPAGATHCPNKREISPLLNFMFIGAEMWEYSPQNFCDFGCCKHTF